LFCLRAACAESQNRRRLCGRQGATLFVVRHCSREIAGSERNLRKTPMTRWILRRRCKCLLKVSLRRFIMLKRELVDRQILKGRDKPRVYREDLVELLVCLFPSVRRRQCDAQEISGPEIVRSFDQDCLEQLGCAVELLLLNQADGILVVARLNDGCIRPGRMKAEKKQDREHPQTRRPVDPEQRWNRNRNWPT